MVSPRLMAEFDFRNYGSELVGQLQPVALGPYFLAPPRLLLFSVAFAPHPRKNNDLSAARLGSRALLVPLQAPEFKNQCHRLPLGRRAFSLRSAPCRAHAHNPDATLTFESHMG